MSYLDELKSIATQAFKGLKDISIGCREIVEALFKLLFPPVAIFLFCLLVIISIAILYFVAYTSEIAFGIFPTIVILLFILYMSARDWDNTLIFAIWAGISTYNGSDLGLGAAIFLSIVAGFGILPTNMAIDLFRIRMKLKGK